MKSLEHFCATGGVSVQQVGCALCTAIAQKQEVIKPKRLMTRLCMRQLNEYGNAKQQREPAFSIPLSGILAVEAECQAFGTAAGFEELIQFNRDGCVSP